MILPDYQIAELCEQWDMVTPFEPFMINPASIDVRLGPNLLVERSSDDTMIPMSIDGATKDDPFWLKPGWFVLGETIEVFSLLPTIAAQFMLKSSLARAGLQHLMAGYCDPGWHGSRLTLELHNSRQLHGIPLWPNRRIGQMIFHRMAAPPDKSYRETGRYNNDMVVTGSKDC